MIIIGSTAAKFHDFDLGRGKPQDIDVIGTLRDVTEYIYGFECFKTFDSETEWQKEYLDSNFGRKIHYSRLMTDGNWLHVEADIVEPDTHNEVVYEHMTASNGFIWQPYGICYANLEWLRFFKESHKYKKDSPHFWKTRHDIERYRKNHISLPQGTEELLKERERLTYTNKLPNLNQKSKTFFRESDGFYEYDHDSIHEVVAVLDKPAYTHYMKDGSEVLTDRNKFFSVPEIIRLLGCYEEAMVLTYERSLIPFNFKPDRRKAFIHALSKVATSITGGYFREYCYNNIYKVIALYDKFGYDTHNRVEKALLEGKIKRFGGQ